jgi:hypothetical protein
VTIGQMVVSLVRAVEDPVVGRRIVDVPASGRLAGARPQRHNRPTH